MTRDLNNILCIPFLLVMLSACAAKTYDRDSFQHSTISQPTTTSELFYTATRKLAFEDEGRFIMVEGSECTQRDHGPGSATMLLSIDMPEYVDSGTALLNGWDLRYLQSDHEVRQLRAEITHSKLVTGGGGPPTLVFEVEGELSDQNWDDDYVFCVYYTGIGFNSAWFDAKIEGDYSGIDTWALQIDDEGAVSTLESLWEEGTLRGGDSVAVIPRGFNFQYDNEFECELRYPPCRWEDPADHHLLQVAYSLFPTGASSNPGGNLHWVTQTIFKDNSVRTHWIETRAALIGGSSVEQRPELLPLNPRSGGSEICRNRGDGEVRTETIRLYDIPYDYAVPMLTGWDLSYECDDQHVQRVGIWIHDIRFDPATNGLEYKLSSILRDRNGNPDFNTTHRITVLGLNSLVAPTTQPPLPELDSNRLQN